MSQEYDSPLVWQPSFQLSAVMQRYAYHQPFRKLHSRVLVTGRMVYHGPREQVVPFFDSLGFSLPERKGVADFLQEICSQKDQEVCHALYLSFSCSSVIYLKETACCFVVQGQRVLDTVD